MKVRVDRDEAWPEYFLDRGGRETEVPDGFDKKYQRVVKQWREVQRVLGEPMWWRLVWDSEDEWQPMTEAEMTAVQQCWIPRREVS
jgi:hypothetical protein